MLPGETLTMCMIWHMFPGLDLYCTDPAQHLTTAGEDLSDLDRDLSDLDRHLSDLGRDLSDLYRHLSDLFVQLDEDCAQTFIAIYTTTTSTFAILPTFREQT